MISFTEKKLKEYFFFHSRYFRYRFFSVFLSCFNVLHIARCITRKRSDALNKPKAMIHRTKKNVNSTTRATMTTITTISLRMVKNSWIVTKSIHWSVRGDIYLSIVVQCLFLSIYQRRINSRIDGARVSGPSRRKKKEIYEKSEGPSKAFDPSIYSFWAAKNLRE